MCQYDVAVFFVILKDNVMERNYFKEYLLTLQGILQELEEEPLKFSRMVDIW